MGKKRKPKATLERRKYVKKITFCVLQIVQNEIHIRAWKRAKEESKKYEMMWSSQCYLSLIRYSSHVLVRCCVVYLRKWKLKFTLYIGVEGVKNEFSIASLRGWHWLLTAIKPMSARNTDHIRYVPFPTRELRPIFCFDEPWICRKGSSCTFITIYLINTQFNVSVGQRPSSATIWNQNSGQSDKMKSMERGTESPLAGWSHKCRIKRN